MKSQESFVEFVGVDVFKEKLDIGIRNELLIIENNTEAIQQLVSRMKSDSVMVVMEANGGYESKLVQVLHQHGIPLAVCLGAQAFVPK